MSLPLSTLDYIEIQVELVVKNIFIFLFQIKKKLLLLHLYSVHSRIFYVFKRQAYDLTLIKIIIVITNSNLSLLFDFKFLFSRSRPRSFFMSFEFVNFVKIHRVLRVQMYTFCKQNQICGFVRAPIWFTCSLFTSLFEK